MTFSADWDLAGDIVGRLELVALDTTEGVCRFIVGADGRFTDINGNTWLGSKLITMSELELSINGAAPGGELRFSYVQDPDEEDLWAAIQASGGVASVRGREATLWFQWIGAFGEFFKPVSAPILVATRTMLNLTYAFDGPQQRTVAVTLEGPFNLRSTAPGGRYTTTDHSRRAGADNPSLEFMPTNSYDEEPLFGI